MLEYFMEIIGSLGFPIALTVYLLARFEKRIEKLEIVIRDLSNVIRDTTKIEKS